MKKYPPSERRKKHRMYEPLALIVRGSADRGASYQLNATTRDIGPGGLRATAPRIMEVGEAITLLVRFALAGSDPPQAPVMAARAMVLRVDKNSEKSCTFAASFLRHRFI